jgi:hypothetical protein
MLPEQSTCHFCHHVSARSPEAFAMFSSCWDRNSQPPAFANEVVYHTWAPRSANSMRNRTNEVSSKRKLPLCGEVIPDEGNGLQWTVVHSWTHPAVDQRSFPVLRNELCLRSGYESNGVCSRANRFLSRRALWFAQSSLFLAAVWASGSLLVRTSIDADLGGSTNAAQQLGGYRYDHSGNGTREQWLMWSPSPAVTAI